MLQPALCANMKEMNFLQKTIHLEIIYYDNKRNEADTVKYD